jgi:hypothetical protein
MRAATRPTKLDIELWMLTIYGKNVRENIPAHILKRKRFNCRKEMR